MSGIFVGMKLKTSVTLSQSVLSQIDKATVKGAGRSAFIEEAVVYYLAARRKRARDERDRVLLNEHATELNAEAEDVLAYQKLR